MITIHLPGGERLNENDEFVYWDSVDVDLEHSLVSISKWEAKFKRPYLKPNDEKTPLEMFEYIKMMSLTPGVSDDQWSSITVDSVKAIKEYIDDNKTATTFPSNKKKKSTEIITSELIYAWMVLQQIPFECENWHLSRLLTLINVVSIKNQPDEKPNKMASMQQTAALNKARRAKNSKPHIPHH